MSEDFIVVDKRPMPDFLLPKALVDSRPGVEVGWLYCCLVRLADDPSLTEELTWQRLVEITGLPDHAVFMAATSLVRRGWIAAELPATWEDPAFVSSTAQVTIYDIPLQRRAGGAR